jgi:hypothetical protein
VKKKYVFGLDVRDRVRDDFEIEIMRTQMPMKERSIFPLRMLLPLSNRFHLSILAWILFSFLLGFLIDLFVPWKSAICLPPQTGACSEQIGCQY